MAAAPSCRLHRKSPTRMTAITNSQVKPFSMCLTSTSWYSKERTHFTLFAVPTRRCQAHGEWFHLAVGNGSHPGRALPVQTAAWGRGHCVGCALFRTGSRALYGTVCHHCRYSWRTFAERALRQLIGSDRSNWQEGHAAAAMGT